MPDKTSVWFVYLVECADGTLYSGVATDVQRRLRQHNGEIVGGAKYTRARRPVKLVYSAQFEDRSKAQKEESRIKSLTRAQKQRLIDDANN